MWFWGWSYKRGSTVLQNISNGLGLFWYDFPKKIPSEPLTHPPISTVFHGLFRRQIFDHEHFLIMNMAQVFKTFAAHS